MPTILQSLLGLIIFIAFAWAISENRRRFPWRTASAALLLQVLLAAALLKIPAFRQFFLHLNEALLALERATQEGTALVFGYLGGAPLPFAETGAGSSFILAFRALPLVLVISALSALLFHWRILPWLVRAAAAILRKILGVGGAVGLSAAASVFVGMVEAPLFVRPYLTAMSRGELFAVMTCGMATIAGTVMVLYASFLAPVVPDAIGHILTASLINVPAAILIAAIMVPPDPQTTAGELTPPQTASSSVDAVTQGTLAGIELFLNIIALLIVFVALVSLINAILGLLPAWQGQPLTLQRLLGGLMAPVVWLIGITWSEAITAGGLMGTKTVLNELIAYLDLARLPAAALSPRSRLIMTYALCGFANLGSLGILIGGLGAMAPERRNAIVALGPKSILSGTLATLMSGAVVGMLVI